MVLDSEQPYQKMPVNFVHYKNDGHFRKVSLFKAEIMEDEFKHRRIKCTFRSETRSDAWTQATILAVKCNPNQRSVDDNLNPTDYYLTLDVETAPGIGTGSGPTPNIEFSLDFGMPSKTLGITYHLSFIAGMSAGWNRWLLYKLDLSNPERIGFDFVKTYTYTQGQVVDNT